MTKWIKDFWHKISCHRCRLCKRECEDGVMVEDGYDQIGFPDYIYICKDCKWFYYDYKG